MVLTDGERLQGKFESSAGASAKFKSDVLGELTVDWSKVMSLETSNTFAVIPPNVKINRKTNLASIPQGKIAVANQNVTVTPATGPTQTVPVANADHIVAQADFTNAVEHNPDFLQDWSGTVTAGASLIQATQEARAFNAAIALIRTVPDQDWLTPRNRTTVDFSTSYSTITQPAVPTIKTSIYHAGIQRDEYFSKSVFVFGQALFDHNFSQGLDLQQTYGGGIGWSVIHRPNETLDLRAGMSYIRQEFAVASQNENLIASIFGEDYSLGLTHGVKFLQELVVTPAWNNTNAWSALGSASVSVPVYARFNLTFGIVENYLNNPAPGFKKNSFQANLGVTYALR